MWSDSDVGSKYLGRAGGPAGRVWCGTGLHRAVPGDFGLGWGGGWNDQWDSPAGAAWRAGGRRFLGIVRTAKPILAFFCGEGAWFLEGAAEMSGARAGSWDGWWPTDVYTLLQKPTKFPQPLQ